MFQGGMALAPTVARPARPMGARGAPLAQLDRVRLFGARLGLRVIVALPVRQEAAELQRALAALAESLADLHMPAGIVLLINNSHDASAEIAAGFGENAVLPVYAFEATLAPPVATAGHARRLALDLAAAVAGDAAVLLTTDADTVVDRAWASRLVAAVDGGAALALAAVEPDPAGLAGLPGPLRAMAAVEAELYAAKAELWRALLPGAPQLLALRASGAGMAIDARAYRRVSGMPLVGSGEDRAMARSLVACGETVAMVPDARASTSCRLASGTPGGMAATLARRAAGERAIDGDLLPPAAFVERALAFGHLRGQLPSGRVALERRLGLPAGRLHPSPEPAARFFEILDGIDRPAPMSLDEGRRSAGHYRLLRASLPAEPANILSLADGLSAASSRSRPHG